ncbi:MAG: hypothetical protein V1758_02115 [Pseudomonadota bacterium]
MIFKGRSEDVRLKGNAKRLLVWSIIGTGISSVTVQLITIREFLTQFHGNEITISLVLFSWLLLTGLGSLVSKALKRSSMSAYSILIAAAGLWPLLQIVLIRDLRETLFIHGAAPGFYPMFLYILATTAPYCLLVGFILPYALRVLNDRHYPFTSGELYLTDSIGDIAGGILFSFVLVYWMKPFKTIALTSALLIAVALMLQLGCRRYFLFLLTVLLSALFYHFSLSSNFEMTTLSRQYGNILSYVESPYGRIVISKEGPQHTFWESGIPLYSDADTIRSEEKVHYPLSQIGAVDRILLVSGGLGETLAELSKHRPKHVDYVELDPYLTGIAEKLGFIKRTANLNIYNEDGRHYAKTTSRRYDAIIVDLPEPDTFQLNRFFTSEFFSIAKGVLSGAGVLSFSLPYSPNYLSEIQKKKLSSLYHTARLHFKNVLILPGEEAYFICSDGALSSDIPERLAMKAIGTSYIEGFYRGNVTAERIKLLQEAIDQNGDINMDFSPKVMSLIFQEWFLKHGASPRVFFMVLLGLTILYFVFMKKEEYILFSTGLATMGVEMLVIFTFQVMYGYLYLQIGAIITTFLLGLFPGALLGNLHKDRKRADLVVSELIILCLLIVFFVWIGFFKGEGDLHPFFFLLYCFVFSFFCGYQFPVATGIIGEEKSPAAGCLAADLTGAAIGTLATGTLLIPLWGIQSAIVFLILVKISSNIIILFAKGKEI